MKTYDVNNYTIPKYPNVNIDNNTNNTNSNMNSYTNTNSYSNNSNSYTNTNTNSNVSNVSADDRAIMDNILSVIKGNCDMFMHGTIESTTPNVHQAFKSSLDESLQVQKEIFNQMSQRGWYTTQQAEQQKISQTKQKFSKNQQY